MTYFICICSVCQAFMYAKFYPYIKSLSSITKQIVCTKLIHWTFSKDCARKSSDCAFFWQCGENGLGPDWNFSRTFGETKSFFL